MIIKPFYVVYNLSLKREIKKNVNDTGSFDWKDRTAGGRDITREQIVMSLVRGKFEHKSIVARSKQSNNFQSPPPPPPPE